MKQIVIEKLLIENFKKIKSLEIDFSGKNVNFIGKNQTGKTSIFDAFSWCLFGKNSAGDADNNPTFEIKPKDPITGEAIHNLETVVELTLSINGDLVVLKRLYREVYTKKRNTGELEFTGHETVYYINGVEKLQKDYKKYIEDFIVAEDLFKLLTSVTAFNELHWEKRREVLNVLAKVSEEDVIAANPILEPLKTHLILGNTVEDVIKIHEQDKKKIAKRREQEIPSELKVLHGFEYKNLEENYNDAANEEKLEKSFTKLSDIEAKLASGTDQSKINELENAKLEFENTVKKLEREIETLEHAALTARSNEIQNQRGVVSELELKVKTLLSQKSNTEDRIKNGEKLITELEAKKEKLLDEYDAIQNEEFKATSCNFCGQALPVDKLEEAKEHFNAHQSERLEANIATGKATAEEIKKYTDAITAFRSEIEEIDVKVAEINAEIDVENAALNDLVTIKPPKSDVVIEKEAEIERYQSRIQTQVNVIKKTKEQGANDILTGARNEIKNELQLLNTKKAEYQLKLQNEEKINKLEKEQKDLNIKFEETVRIITLGEKFREIQSKHIEQEINKRFKLVDFQMFNEAINGTITPACVAKSKKGVVFGSCSNGQRINMGLDIINALQEIYGVSAPIFIDNAEAVSDWEVDLNSQLIKMYVDPSVGVLEIEFEEEV